MKTLLRFGGAILGVAAIGYFLIFAYRTATLYHLEPLLSAPMTAAIGVAALSYALIVPVTSWAWSRLLRDTGVRFPMLHLNMILGLTQIAKYLPGNIGQHLGRSAMSIRRGIRPGPVLVTLAVELVLAISAAISVGVVALMMAVQGTPTIRIAPWAALVVAMLCIGLTLIGLPYAVRKLQVMAQRVVPSLPTGAPVGVPGTPALSAAFGAYVLNYLLIGAGLYAIAFAASGIRPSALPFFIATFALSWAAGFVVPGAPAGLGVREGVMSALLAPILDGPATLTVVVGFRVATTVGDLIALLWGATIYVTRSARGKPSAVSSSARGGGPNGT